MNGVVAFDALEFVETLQASGFNEEQAKGMAGAIRRAQDAHLEELATKHDIDLVRRDIDLVRRDTQEMEANLKRDMREMETNLRRDMGEMETNLRRDMGEMETNLKHDIKELESRLEARLIKWVVGVAGGQAALIVALLKILP